MTQWLGALELMAGAAAMALAIIVVAAAPRRRDNQALGLLLAVDGIGWLGVAGGLLNLGFAPDLTGLAVRATVAASPWLFALFVARALDVPLTRRLRTPAGTVALLAAAVIVPPLVIGVLHGVPAYQAVNQYVGLVSGPNVIIAAWALLAAVQWSRQSDDPRAARAYLDAFALRSVALLVLFGAVLLAKNVSDAQRLLLLAETVAVSLLAVHLGYLLYGLLSGQVLGLDDKVRATIQKTMVLAVVATIFLILTEGTEILLGFDSAVLSIVAAGIITLAFMPIHTAAERMARRLLPGDARTPDMPRRERLEWLAADMEIALADGRLGEKERRMLEASRRRLGLTREEADELLAKAQQAAPDEQVGEPRDPPRSRRAT